MTDEDGSVNKTYMKNYEDDISNAIKEKSPKKLSKIQNSMEGLVKHYI